MRTKLYSVTASAGGRISIMARPRGGDWIHDEMAAASEAGVDVIVSALIPDEIRELALTAEEQAAIEAGIAFRALPIPDRGTPTTVDGSAKLLVELAALVRRGQHIAVHCRMGIGRSSMIAATVLGLLGEDVDDAFGRLQIARGTPIPDTEEQRDWAKQAVAAIGSAQPDSERPG